MVVEELKRGDAFKVIAANPMMRYGAEFYFLENMEDEKKCRGEAMFYELTVTFPHGTEVEKV